MVCSDVYNNKPRGLQHWLKYSNPPVAKDSVVALLDPDMIIIRPITISVRDQTNKLYGKYMTESEIVDKVAVGKPVAQMYGLGAPWTLDTHEKFNRTYVCGGADSPCVQVKMQFAGRHYAVGPPYIAHREDMVNIADTWSEFVPK
jgi:hypothetical protein